MRRAALLSLLALGLLGCPPAKNSQAPVPLPTEEVTDPPPPPRETHPAADDKPAAITSADVANIMSQAKDGVITALPHLKVFVKEKRIELEGLTAMKVGPQLELLACSQRGKAYESLLIWLCEP